MSVAVTNKWPIATTDISKAFLQGVTYEELHRLTGEPIREVNFYLPSSSVSALQKVEGFTDFNPNTEVLHCDKPGTGSVDAPRCFSMKLALCTERIGMKQSSVDPELCFLHDKGKLVCLLTKHVDDLKITGPREWVEKVCRHIENTFGKLKILWGTFTNCGVRHTQNDSTFEVSLDQIEYARALRTIQHPELSRANASTNALCGPELHQLYMSLLGAVAYLYLTRVDILVFVAACQRWAHKPSIIHVKRLNQIVRYVQRVPMRLHYKSMPHDRHLGVVSDAAFKKEEEHGHSIKGTLYVIRPGKLLTSFHREGVAHVIEFLCKSIRNVTRSTFSAELHAACDACDLGVLLQLMLHEIECGRISSEQARMMREKGGHVVPMFLAIDAMSVFAAVTATYVKAPAEKSLLSHVQFVRELLDQGVLRGIEWWDTRDMTADGLTKGSVDRAILMSLMHGLLKIAHDNKSWSSKLGELNRAERDKQPLAVKYNNAGA